MRLKLTDAAVAKLKAPPKPAQKDYWDVLLPAFGLRVSYSGTKAWLANVRIREKQTRITFGRYPDMSLADARAKARTILQSDDPKTQLAGERVELEVKDRDTFSAVRDRFIKARFNSNRNRTATEYQRVLKGLEFKAWESLPISAIERKDVHQLLESIIDAGTPIKANRTLAYLRSMMNWAVSKDIIVDAPTDRIKPPAAERDRDRSLSNSEIQLAWKAFEAAGHFSPLFKLLLLTGQRRDEVASMRRSELCNLLGEEPLWEIPRERTKMDRPHRVPLSPMAVEIILSVPKIGDELVFTTNGSTPFTAFSYAKDRVDTAIENMNATQKLTGVFQTPWVLHDLRRTAATHMAELGVTRDVVELILNHQSGTRKGVAGIYNRSELLAERRRALNLWAEHVSSLVK